MKIAVATNDEVKVTGHIGRCNAFIVYTVEDTEIVKKEIRKNTFTHHKQYGHSVHHHDEGHSHGHGHARVIDALKDCEALIFKSGGWKLVDDLKQNNIAPILTDEILADDSVMKYAKGELLIKEDNVCNDH